MARMRRGLPEHSTRASWKAWSASETAGPSPRSAARRIWSTAALTASWSSSRRALRLISTAPRSMTERVR